MNPYFCGGALRNGRGTPTVSVSAPLKHRIMTTQVAIMLVRHISSTVRHLIYCASFKQSLAWAAA